MLKKQEKQERPRVSDLLPLAIAAGVFLVALVGYGFVWDELRPFERALARVVLITLVLCLVWYVGSLIQDAWRDRREAKDSDITKE